MNNRELLAKAVCKGVFGALLCAMNNKEDEDRWRKHADKLEHKFTTEYGRHYSYFCGCSLHAAPKDGE